MANWITHMRIADEVLRRLPDLDQPGFCMGSIAPDCNVENEGWTAFTPSREVTHWMSGQSKYKTFDDCETFCDRCIQGRRFADPQERSFYLGYYAHLIVDVMWTEFTLNEQRVQAMWRRISAVPELAEKAQDAPETYESIRQLFAKPLRSADVIALENEYLYTHPQTAYLTVLQTVRSFPDYLDYLPKGAILRKIGVMGSVPERYTGTIKEIFFTREEMEQYIADTCDEIVKRLSALQV